MEKDGFFVVFHEGQWKIKNGDIHSHPYATEREAIESAIEAAQHAEQSGKPSQVLVQGEDMEFQEVTHDNNPSLRKVDQHIHHSNDRQPTPAYETFAGDAIWQLDRAMMILANAKSLSTPEEIKRSIDHAVEEIEPVFEQAKRASAELRGIPDADVE